MDDLDKIKSLSKKIATSLLKGETPIDLEKFKTLTEDDKKRIIFGITNRNKREERLQLKKELNKEKALKAIIGKEKQKLIRQKTFKYSAIAASVVILLSITVLLNKDDGPQINTSIIAENNIKIGTDKAVLTLEDGSEVHLEKGQAYQLNNITSNGEKITYPTGQQGGYIETKTEEIAYNVLTVPRGGQFIINLSDGTEVWLNSESQLKYPVAFNNGETRQVELVYGEAYFDVSPSTEHKGAKFKVSNEFQEVEVLGTEFNIKAYKDEANIYTTLVEGEVAVSSQGEKQSLKLKPDQQLNLNTQNNSLNIVAVSNMYKEVSWRKGKFSFRDESIKDIMNTLSRWYDMDVIFENKNVENEIYSGSFRKNSPIKEIMSAIKQESNVNGYYIKDKTLTIM
ncbi:DUF4974 domain-containing protein [Flavivirga aquimarina]|uniref:DUF4974 domain-containing protein n=1 Tax=Flavivirga aquimarina TaxID=2027862 RepID=A0ABT8WBA1_9FLAO|nr:FecR family protein [Flavivirga aquimarina]MDO5970413.1 DUF4974 domain-containing protein [Flavivirga aquimarina]